MSSTLSELTTYLELMEMPKSLIQKVLKRKDMMLYGILSDRLTHMERLELQAVFKDVYHGDAKLNRIDFSKYVSLDNKEKEIASDVMSSSSVILSSIIQMDPKDVAFNVVNELL